LGLLAGASVTSQLKIHLPVPLCQYTDICNSMVIILPAWFKYTLPSSVSRSSRALADEQESVYQWAEDLLNRSGLPGRDCLLLAVCQMAKSADIDRLGMAGRVLQAVFMMDPSEDMTEYLLDYIQAKKAGEAKEDCDAVYQECPIEVTDFSKTMNVTLPQIIQSIL